MQYRSYLFDWHVIQIYASFDVYILLVATSIGYVYPITALLCLLNLSYVISFC